MRLELLHFRAGWFSYILFLAVYSVPQLNRGIVSNQKDVFAVEAREFSGPVAPLDFWSGFDELEFIGQFANDGACLYLGNTSVKLIVDDSSLADYLDINSVNESRGSEYPVSIVLNFQFSGSPLLEILQFLPDSAKGNAGNQQQEGEFHIPPFSTHQEEVNT
jgi:hypothetical protein